MLFILANTSPDSHQRLSCSVKLNNYTKIGIILCMFFIISSEKSHKKKKSSALSGAIALINYLAGTFYGLVFLTLPVFCFNLGKNFISEVYSYRTILTWSIPFEDNSDTLSL